MGVRKTGTTLIRVSTVMGTLYYEQIKEILDEARAQVYHSANSAMVKAYWSIGKKIYEACNENDRAEYGKALL